MAEAAAGAALSGAERERLREKLALLRREYSETVSRLRRARRAERARGHAGRRPAEDGEQRPAEPGGRRSPTGSRDSESPGADRHETWSIQAKACSAPDTEKKTSVTLKHAPEFVSDEVSLQDSSLAESAQARQGSACCGGSRPATEEKKTQTSRSMMKLRRRRTKTLVSEKREPVHGVHRVKADETVKNQTVSAEQLRSPVFRQGSFSNTAANAQSESRPAIVGKQEDGLTPPDAELGVLQDVLEDSLPLGVPELLPCVPGDSSDVWQPESPGAVATSNNRAPAQLRSENGESDLLGAGGDGGKESLRVIKQTDSESVHGDQGELRGLFGLTSANEVLPAGRNNNVISESESHEGNENDTGGSNAFPSDLALGNAEKLLENQQLEIQPGLSHLENVAAPESALSSCTMVEGLLFPVEYYVRTTRRMSNCQRKVDLDAVILSQLGRSKKGQRSKCRQKDADSNQPSQETVENDLESAVVPFPFLCTENDPVNSSSPQKTLLTSSGSSNSPGSISQSSTTSTKRDQRRSQRKQKGRRKSAHKPVSQTSQELIESLDLITPRESSSPLSNECQSEKENCEANLEKSSSDERRVSVAAALGSGAAGAIQPKSADPGGSQGPGKCRKTLLEQVQNPLQKSDSPNPRNKPFVSHTGDLECKLSVCQSDKSPVEHLQSQHVQAACGAEQLLAINAPPRRSLRSSARQRDSQASKVLTSVKQSLAYLKVQEYCRKRKCWEKSQTNGSGTQSVFGSDILAEGSMQSSCGIECVSSEVPLPCDESKRGPGHQTDSEGAASLGLPATDARTSSSLFSFRSHQWLVPKLGIEEFHLPDEEFGLLKLEKCESSPVNDLEAFVPSVFGDGLASEDVQAAEMKAEEKGLNRNLISPLKSGSPESSHLESPASKMELSTHELLFTPVGTISTGAPVQPESHISSSIFPVLGGTPAVLPSVCSELLPSTCSVPPLPVSLRSSQEAPAQVMDDGECKDSAIPLHLDSCGAGSASQGEGQGTTFHVEADRHPNNRSDGAVALEEHQQSQSKQQRSCRSPEQKKNEAEQSTPVLFDDLAEENLQFVSKLKDSSSSCAVDVSTVWWEAAGCRELCVVTACENSVSLWKPLAPDHWGKVYTWQLGEIPVIQIIPLLDTCNLICIALGNLEIGEIRLLLYSSENDSFKQSLVKTGNIKAVLGLKERRLVSSSRSMQEQEVEVVSFSETGRSKHGQTLMPPEETVLAFAEVEGVKDALLGTTAVNSIVVWNLKTGQLLKKMHIGYSYPASICHRAYSDSGLLFVVLSHPHAKESESCGNPAFRVIAFNPKTARSTGVIFSSLPPRHAGRYVEGEVKDALASAVLSSGAIAVWDLLLGRCTALLPPGPAGSWALVRWSAAGVGLLAGRGDGGVCLYRYRAPRAPAS